VGEIPRLEFSRLEIWIWSDFDIRISNFHFARAVTTWNAFAISRLKSATASLSAATAVSVDRPDA
jgi:hypothetical protein